MGRKPENAYNLALRILKGNRVSDLVKLVENGETMTDAELDALQLPTIKSIEKNPDAAGYIVTCYDPTRVAVEVLKHDDLRAAPEQSKEAAGIDALRDVLERSVANLHR